MENTQRRILHKKLFFLAESLDLSDGFFREAVRQGLLSAEEIDRVKSQHSQYESVRELIRTVSQYSGPGFEKLCYLLERTGLGHVTDELQAEVSREKDVEIPQYVLRENESMLERPLTHTVNGRRVIDKDDIVKIAATRFMVGKDIGKLLAKRKITEVNREKLSIIDDIEKVEKVIDDILVLYGGLRAATPRPNNPVTFSPQTHPPIYHGPNGHVTSYQNKLSVLEGKAKSLIEAYQGLLKINEGLMKERARCFYLIGFGESDRPSPAIQKMRLDTELQSVLASSTVELDKRRLEVVSKEDMAKALEVEVNGLKLESDLKLKYIQRENDVLSKKVILKDEEVNDLKETLVNKVRSEKVLQTKMDELRKRCEMLENTRRIGYFSESINTTGGKSQDHDRNKDLFQLQLDKVSGSATNSQVLQMNDDKKLTRSDSAKSRRASRPQSGDSTDGGSLGQNFLLSVGNDSARGMVGTFDTLPPISTPHKPTPSINAQVIITTPTPTSQLGPTPQLGESPGSGSDSDTGYIMRSGKYISTRVALQPPERGNGDM